MEGGASIRGKQYEKHTQKNSLEYYTQKTHTKEGQKMTNQTVVQQFIKGQPGKCLSMYTDGHKLFSYNTIIAQREGNIMLVNTTKYSMTTSKHQGLLYREINKQGYALTTSEVYIDGVRIEENDLIDYVK